MKLSKQPTQRRQQIAASKQRHIARHNEVVFVWPNAKKIAEREKYRWNLRRFCDEVFPQWFSLPHGEDQLAALAAIQDVVKHGKRRAIARPRGSGKTRQTLAACVWAAVFHHAPYTVLFAANARMARKNLQNIMRAFVFNPKLRRLWPEYCTPIAAAFQRPNRAAYLSHGGEPLFLEASTTRLVLPYYKGRGDSVAVLECAGILEAARGLSFDAPNGETLRPRLLIGDDFQTKASARSHSQCALRIETITGDFAQMGGANTATGIVLNATTIEQGDAADQLLDRKKHPEFVGLRQSFIKSWPTASRRGMEQRKAPYDAEADKWATYCSLRKAGQADDDGGKAANEFYAVHRAAMDAGGVVGWESCFIAKRGEVSALQHAFNVIADDGEKVFFSEFQNMPITNSEISVRLTADNVLQRLNGLPPGEVPEESQIITGFIDANDHALAWAVCAWHVKADTVTGAVIGYGEWARAGNGKIGDTHRPDKIWDENKPAAEGKPVAFWGALNGLAAWLHAPGRWTRKGRNVLPSLVLVDSGYTLAKGDTTIFRWIANSGGSFGYSRGWPARTFRFEKTSEGSNSEVLKASRENWWRFERYKPLENVFGLPHDAEFHDRATQAAWTLPAGAPGSLTLNGTRPEEHLAFAAQIAGVKLLEFKNADAAGVSGLYLWAKTPGVRNEMSDCVRGCRLAALYRLGDTGSAPAMSLNTAPNQPAAQGPAPAPAQQSQPTRPTAPRRDRHSISYVAGWEPWRDRP